MDQSIRLGDDLIKGKNTNNKNNGRWHLFGKICPRSEIMFFVQVVLVYLVVIVSIVNLTLGRENDKLWLTLLSSSIGYILPNPKLKFNKNEH